LIDSVVGDLVEDIADVFTICVRHSAVAIYNGRTDVVSP
jgi:hypothetical protein